MGTTDDYSDMSPLHPLKRSLKVKLRKELEKQKKEKAKLKKHK